MCHGSWSQGRIFKLILTKLGDILGAWNHEVKENIFKSKSLKMSIVDSVGTMILVSLHVFGQFQIHFRLSDCLKAGCHDNTLLVVQFSDL